MPKDTLLLLYTNINRKRHTPIFKFKIIKTKQVPTNFTNSIFVYLETALHVKMLTAAPLLLRSAPVGGHFR